MPDKIMKELVDFIAKKAFIDYTMTYADLPEDFHITENRSEEFF